MACRIREDPPTPFAAALVEQGGAPVEDVLLSAFEVLDPQVQVELLGLGGVRPPWWSMVLHPLEGEHEPVGVKGRPAVAERPPRIRPVHLAAEERPVEPGQPDDVGTVQHHTLELGDHEASVSQHLVTTRAAAPAPAGSGRAVLGMLRMTG